VHKGKEEAYEERRGRASVRPNISPAKLLKELKKLVLQVHAKSCQANLLLLVTVHYTKFFRTTRECQKWLIVQNDCRPTSTQHRLNHINVNKLHLNRFWI
jgi:hypothetical protein